MGDALQAHPVVMVGIMYLMMMMMKKKKKKMMMMNSVCVYLSSLQASEEVAEQAVSGFL